MMVLQASAAEICCSLQIGGLIHAVVVEKDRYVYVGKVVRCFDLFTALQL